MTDAREVIARTTHSWRVLNFNAAEREADAIIAALTAAGLEIRKSVDLKKHYSWCSLVDTECNCGGREAASDE